MLFTQELFLVSPCKVFRCASIPSYSLSAAQSVPATSLRFIYDGRRLGDSETPKEVESFDKSVSVLVHYLPYRITMLPAT